MNTLYIDTRDNKRVIAGIDKEGSKFDEYSDSENRRPESVLKLIKKVCQKAKISIFDIDEIKVEVGPGSYTGLKVGISVANALSFSLTKKVNGQILGTLIEPTYE